MCLSHLRFRTAVETAQVTPGTHNNRINADTVRNRLRGLAYVLIVRTLVCHDDVRLEWRGSNSTGQTCFPFVSDVMLCFLMSPGTYCTQLTAVNVCIGLSESVIVTIAWLNVIGLEVVRKWCELAYLMVIERPWYSSMAL